MSIRSLIAIAGIMAGTAQAGLVIHNPEVIWASPHEDLRALRVNDDHGNERLSILNDGTLSLNPGATINYSILFKRRGQCYGYVTVRVMGEPMLMPVYRMHPVDSWQPSWGQWGTENKHRIFPSQGEC